MLYFCSEVYLQKWFHSKSIHKNHLNRQSIDIFDRGKGGGGGGAFFDFSAGVAEEAEEAEPYYAPVE